MESNHSFRQLQAHDLALIYARTKFEQEYHAFRSPDAPEKPDSLECIQQLQQYYMDAFSELANMADECFDPEHYFEAARKLQR